MTEKPLPRGSRWTAPSTSAQGPDARPANCRFRLQDEGKAYPKSSCTACGKGIATGLGRYCTASPAASPTSPSGVREAAELLAHLKRIPMVEWVWSDAEWIFRVLAALSSSAGPAEPVVFPAYGKMSFDELGQAVRAAQFGEPEPYQFDPEFYPGHQMVGPINFNSLNRIVTWFVERAAHPAPATVDVREAAAQAALARIRGLRDGYADQAKFADVDEARLFRQFVERLDRAALAPATEGSKKT